jgi:hypothetical protein
MICIGASSGCLFGEKVLQTSMELWKAALPLLASQAMVAIVFDSTVQEKGKKSDGK